MADLSFGTDGVRGVANTQLTPDYVLALGRAAGSVLRDRSASDGRPTVVTGADTRASSPMLAAALAAGLASAGVDVLDAGVLPTAGVALVARDIGAIGGAVVSASHNPADDNGVKFFEAGGQKLSDDGEAAIETLLRAAADTTGVAAPRAGTVASSEVGTIRAAPELAERYVEICEATVATPLDGLVVVADCANGAAWRIGPEVLRRAGAVVHVINDTPDGRNINDGCGATAPGQLTDAVVAHGAAVGLAFDGDADRLVAVDETGAVVDGDAILAVAALDLKARGVLAGDAVVATVMSNLGLRSLLADHGVDVALCGVGDRNVLVEMERRGLVLGGEQSGHVIFRDLAPTGCGILTALEVCQVVVRAAAPLSVLTAALSPVEQRLENVTLVDRSVLERADALWTAVAEVEAELLPDGEVLVRPSGTEPKLRIMVQHPDPAAVDDAVRRLTDVARSLR
jgi:phosphoglucosamine mutase